MRNKEDKQSTNSFNAFKNGHRLSNAILVAVLIILLISMVIIGVCMWRTAQKNKQADILIVSATTTTYRNGSGSVNAVLKVGNKIEEDEELTFIGDKAGLISFPDSVRGIYHVQDDVAAEPVDGKPIIVEVYVTNTTYDITQSILINIVESPPYVISLDTRVKSAELCPPTIGVWGDVVGAEKGAETIKEMYEPNLNDIGITGWDFIGWFYWDKFTQSYKKFNASDRYCWDDDITLHARYLAKEVILSADGITKNAPPLKEVYYGEPLTANQKKQLIDAEKFVNSENKEFNWICKGWCSKQGGQGKESGIIDNGLPTERFENTANILYAKWEGELNFHLTKQLEKVIEDGEWRGVVRELDNELGQIFGSHSTIVIYNAAMPDLVEPSYSNGEIFKGWFTKKYGGGENISEKDNYDVKSLDVYDCVQRIITINDNDANPISTEYPKSFKATYGKKISESYQRGLPVLEKDDWIWGQWFTSVDVDSETIEVKVSDYFDKPFVENDDIEFKAKWTGSISLKGVIDSNFDASINVEYGKELNLSPYTEYIFGSWEFKGWYPCEAKDIQQSDSPMELITSTYKGKGNLTLYALWTTNTTLKFNNAKSDVYLKDIIYGINLSNQNKVLPTISEIGKAKDGYKNGMESGWYNENSNYDDKSTAVCVTDNMVSFPKSMSTLYYIWEAETYKVTLNPNSGVQSGNTDIYIKMGQRLPNYAAPTKTGSTFLGYYTQEGKPYYSLNSPTTMASDIDWDIPSNTILYAQWSDNGYSVILYWDDENGNTSSVTTTYGDDMPTAPMPSRTGYAFGGYYTEKNGAGTIYYTSSMASARHWEDLSVTSLHAKWTAIRYRVNYNVNGGNGLTNTWKEVAFNDVYGDLPTPTRNNESGSGGYTSYAFEYWEYDGNKITSNTKMVTANEHTLKAKWKGTWHSCFAAGTLITLADNTQKKIEDIAVGDEIITWSFVSGKTEIKPVTIVWDHGFDTYNIINLKFSNGSFLRIVGTHGVFDLTTNAFEYLTEQNYLSYIGHKFVEINGDDYSGVELVDAYITTENVCSYSLETAQNGNAIAENMLTLTPQEFVELFMCFELGENLRFDEAKMQADIEQYGLYSYEEWSEFVTLDEFYAFNGQYIKILVGKGITTKEQLIDMINCWLR